MTDDPSKVVADAERVTTSYGRNRSGGEREDARRRDGRERRPGSGAPSADAGSPKDPLKAPAPSAAGRSERRRTHVAGSCRRCATTWSRPWSGHRRFGPRHQQLSSPRCATRRRKFPCDRRVFAGCSPRGRLERNRRVVGSRDGPRRCGAFGLRRSPLASPRHAVSGDRDRSLPAG